MAGAIGGEMKDLINNETGSGGIGVFGLLGVAFVVLKLMGYINWSWVWVLAPFWGGLVLIIVLFVILALISGGSSRRW